MMRFKEINIYDIHTGDYVGTSYRLENDDETPQELYRIVKELCDSGKKVTMKKIDKQLRKTGIISWTSDKHKNPMANH